MMMGGGTDILEKELGLVDICFDFAPPGQGVHLLLEPTFHLYSSTDYFLMSKQLVCLTMTASIGNLVLSDHAPVEVVLGSRSPSETPQKPLET